MPPLLGNWLVGALQKGTKLSQPSLVQKDECLIENAPILWWNVKGMQGAAAGLQSDMVVLLHLRPTSSQPFLHPGPNLFSLNPRTAKIATDPDCGTVSWELVIVFFFCPIYDWHISLNSCILCNCLAADGKHMWVTSPVLCGSRGEWSTKKWFQFFFSFGKFRGYEP